MARRANNYFGMPDGLRRQAGMTGQFAAIAGLCLTPDLRVFINPAGHVAEVRSMSAAGDDWLDCHKVKGLTFETIAKQAGELAIEAVCYA